MSLDPKGTQKQICPTPNISALNLDSTPATFGYLIAFNFFNVIHIFIYISPWEI